MSPTARSLEALRKAGALAGVVEQTIHATRPGRKPMIFTRDLFECLDLVAIEPTKLGVLGVQTTSAPNLADRVTKVTQTAAARAWLAAGNRIEVHGWSLRGPRGAPKRWRCTVVDMIPKDGVILGLRRPDPSDPPTP